MTDPRPSPTVVPTVEVMRSGRGPRVANYLIPVAQPRLYRWAAGDTQDNNGVTAISPSGGASGNWVDVPDADKGGDLADDSVTIRPSGNRYRRLPDATLTANRVLTLGVTTDTDTVREGHWIWLALDDDGSFTYAVTNGGPGVGTLGIKPAGARAWLLAYFNGTDWECRGSGLMLART